MNKNEFCKIWLETFASKVSNTKLKECIRENKFIWHVFSWGFIPKNKFLIGDAAKVAFEKACKYSTEDNFPIAEVFNFFDCDETMPINSTYDTANKVDEFLEVYVVHKDFKWTYIKTHEEGFGPYYMEIND